MPDDPSRLFAVLNEASIVAQLAAALFETRLPPGFLVSHFAVLSHLSRGRDGATPLAIARAFQVPKTTMTHTLAGLERHGLVRFAPNAGDGRSKQVWLTPEGLAFRDAAMAGLAPDLADLAARLPEGTAAALHAPLVILRSTLDAMRD
jgi:DNA-binding MarR family transcriptional regulator